MAAPKKIRNTALPTSVQTRQIGIAFESTGLMGLTRTERTRAIIQLSHLLLQAAGVSAVHRDNERPTLP